MLDPSKNASSFIPKQGTPKRARRTMTREIYLFTLISYVVIFATLLATGGVFLYNQYTIKQKDKAVEELSQEIASFKQVDMERVKDFDQRLSMINGRLEASASVLSVLSALEASTVGTVQIESLALAREDDEMYVLEALIVTDSFDSTIFQRGIFKRDSVLADVSFTGLATEASTVGEDDETDDSSSLLKKVRFTAEIEVPLSLVPYTGADESESDTDSKTEESPLEANELEI